MISCSNLCSMWLTARAQACVWWVKKQWESKEVKSLTDSKSSSPFWQRVQEEEKKKGKKSRERGDVRWKQCQLRAECIDYSENEKRRLMSSAVQAATWHMRTCPAGADRPNQRRAGKKKRVFPPIEYVSALHFKDPTTSFPVTVNLAINSPAANFMPA